MGPAKKVRSAVVHTRSARRAQRSQAGPDPGASASTAARVAAGSSQVVKLDPSAKW